MEHNATAGAPFPAIHLSVDTGAFHTSNARKRAHSPENILPSDQYWADKRQNFSSARMHGEIAPLREAKRGLPKLNSDPSPFWNLHLEAAARSDRQAGGLCGQGLDRRRADLLVRLTVAAIIPAVLRGMASP